MFTLDLFKRITQVPRPSRHEEKARAFFIDEAKRLGYAYEVDSIGNVLIKVDGAGSSANSPTLVLQGHMDMVCEKSPDVAIDFMNDPLTVYEEDGYLKAKGTTLGADNGVGVALAFYCAQLPNHPPLEILLTVDEETGMTGADQMKPGFFSGKRVINLDSGQLGVITIGSAGGDDAIVTLDMESYEQYMHFAQLELELQGLKGGHSGGNIGLNRLSATKILADILTQYEEAGFDFRIEWIESGAAANAIARDAKMRLLFAKKEDVASAVKVSSRLESGDGETLTIVYKQQELESEQEASVMRKEKQNELIHLLHALPHGVIAWQDESIKLPRTSANLASVSMQKNAEHLSVKIVLSYRSFDNDMLPEMQRRIHEIVSKTSATYVAGGAYPAWPPKEHSELRVVCSQSYEKLFAKKPLEVARHVGLECGYWERLSPGVDVISIGPNLFDLHSPTERVEIASIAKMEELLTEMMQSL